MPLQVTLKLVHLITKNLKALWTAACLDGVSWIKSPGPIRQRLFTQCFPLRRHFSVSASRWTTHTVDQCLYAWRVWGRCSADLLLNLPSCFLMWRAVSVMSAVQPGSWNPWRQNSLRGFPHSHTISAPQMLISSDGSSILIMSKKTQSSSLNRLFLLKIWNQFRPVVIWSLSWSFDFGDVRGNHTPSSNEGTPKVQIVMADGDYSSESNTLKLMKWWSWRARACWWGSGKEQSQRTENDGEMHFIKISSEMTVS